MGIKLQIPYYLRREIGAGTDLEVEGRTALECLQDLVRRYPALEGDIFDPQGKVQLSWIVYVNDMISERSSALSLPVEDGDSIGIFPVVAGG